MHGSPQKQLGYFLSYRASVEFIAVGPKNDTSAISDAKWVTLLTAKSTICSKVSLVKI